jgi:hypothetical protein
MPKKTTRLAALAAFCLVATCTITSSAQGLYPDDATYRAAFEERSATIREGMARKTWQPGEDTRMRIYLGVVKLATGIDAPTGLRYLEDAVADTNLKWHSFEQYAFMDAVLRLGDKLPAPLVEKIRGRLAGSFTDDFGFTDNHMLQIRTARYLFAQTWPDGPNFADGSTPREALHEATGWIERWIDATVTRGMYEFDSPNYHHLYLLCFATLHQYAQDPVLQKKSWMIMQVLLADWATEYLHGTWVGSHSREKYNQVLHTREHTGAATQFGRLYFGDAPIRLDLAESYFISLAALQDFKSLPMIGRMATDRSQPYILRELKAPRRGPLIVYGEPTWKYTYVADEFSVGSSWGDLTDVEHHRWDLTWKSEADGSTCFFINPSYSSQQLHRYFADPLEVIRDRVVHERPYYADPNKWVEGSPYEDLMQHDTAVIDLYDIPANSERQHINGFFPHIIAERREAGGWIFARVDEIYFAVWTSVPGQWHNEGDYDRLTILHPKTAIVLEAVAAKDAGSFDAFCADRLAHTPTFDEASMTARYTTTSGRQLQFTHHGARLVDDQPVELNHWPLFEGPWLNAKRGTGIITLSYGTERVVLDFNTTTVTTEKTE